MVIVFKVPFPHTYHFPKIFKDPWSHAIGRLLPNSSSLSLCPFIWNSHLFYLHNFFCFWWQYLKQNFQKYKNFLHLLKSVNNKHAFFELMSSWSVHQHPIRERLHSGRETWLSIVERTSTLSKMQSWSRNSKKKNQKNQKKLAKLKTWKGDLGNRERPGGPKTRKGGPGKN